MPRMDEGELLNVYDHFNNPEREAYPLMVELKRARASEARLVEALKHLLQISEVYIDGAPSVLQARAALKGAE